VRGLCVIPVAVLLLVGCDLGRDEKLIRMPNVVGMKWPDAANRIAASGLCYGWGRLSVSDSGGHVGLVVAQRPSGGQQVAPLSQVSIDIAQAKDRGRAQLYLTEQNRDCPDPGPPLFVASP
jgi:hypothetical protein